MSTYLKAFITLIILIYVQGCSTDNKENLVLDSEGGLLDDTDSNSTEIEVEENVAQKIEIDEVESVNQQLTNQLIEVGDRVFFEYDQTIISEERVLERSILLIISCIHLSIDEITLSYLFLPNFSSSNSFWTVIFFGCKSWEWM